MKCFIHLPMKMEPIVSSETSGIRTQTPGNHPKRNKLHFIMFLCLSPMEQLGYHWTHFHEIWCFRILRKSFEKIQFSLKYDNNVGYFTWRPVYINGNISLKFFLESEIFKTKFVEKIKTHVLCSINPQPLENLTVYEITWKNVLEPDWPCASHAR